VLASVGEPVTVCGGPPVVVGALSALVVLVVLVDVGSSGSVAEVDAELVVGSPIVALDSVALVRVLTSSCSGHPARRAASTVRGARRASEEGEERDLIDQSSKQ